MERKKFRLIGEAVERANEIFAVEGVDMALDYAGQVDAINSGYDDRYDPTPFVNDAMKPAPMVDFTVLE